MYGGYAAQWVLYNAPDDTGDVSGFRPGKTEESAGGRNWGIGVVFSCDRRAGQGAACTGRGKSGNAYGSHSAAGQGLCLQSVGDDTGGTGNASCISSGGGAEALYSQTVRQC